MQAHLARKRDVTAEDLDSISSAVACGPGDHNETAALVTYKKLRAAMRRDNLLGLLCVNAHALLASHAFKRGSERYNNPVCHGAPTSSSMCPYELCCHLLSRCMRGDCGFATRTAITKQNCIEWAG